LIANATKIRRTTKFKFIQYGYFEAIFNSVLHFKYSIQVANGGEKAAFNLSNGNHLPSYFAYSVLVYLFKSKLQAN